MYQIQHVIIKKKKKKGQEWATMTPTNADAEINIADDMRFQEIGQEIDKLK